MTDPASLQNLHPIIPPPQVGLWPLAPGWYLLLSVAVIFAARFLFFFLKYQKANRYRKAALEKLAIIRAEIRGGKSEVLRELPLLVKGVALEVYPRSEIAGLHGESWLNVLDITINSTEFSAGPGQLLPTLSYQPPEELAKIEKKKIDELTALIEHWIRNHLPFSQYKEVDHV